MGVNRVNRVDTLRRFFETVAFSLVISALLYLGFPGQPYEHQLVYSIAIGIPIWAIIEFGRLVVMPNPDTGWPSGWGGPLLVTIAVVGGYFIGSYAGNAWFGRSGWMRNEDNHRISWLVTAVAGIAASAYFFFRGKTAYLHAHMQAAQRQAAEAQLKLLQSQLEPHMLFNTLANLRALIGTDPDRAQDMLDRMIAYLRATLGSSRVNMHPLQAEFDRLRDYLELMAVRMGPRLQYTLDLPAELAALPVPPLLLQPLVENAIKHGLEPKVQGGSITVRARLDGGLMTLDVLDTGVGLGSAPLSANGFGLAQVRERLLTTYGPQGAIEIIATPAGGTWARATFPINSAANQASNDTHSTYC
jgi:signal transduction histidine kinase